MKNTLATTALLVGFAAALPAYAQVLMLDFGPTPVSSPSDISSPYHAANGAFTDATWNSVTNTDASSFVYSNGATATGIAVNVGGSQVTSGTPDLGTVLLATNPSGNSSLAGQTNTGVYAGTSVGRDGIFHSSKNTVGVSNVGTVGVQITGLAAGAYDIYFTGRNTSINFITGPGTETITAYAGAGVAGADFAFGSYTSGANSFNSAGSFTSSWIQGENYIKLTVTLLSGQALNIASSGAGSTAGGGAGQDQRGFINSLQIVPVASIPEPSSYAAILGALATGLVAARRRCRA